MLLFASIPSVGFSQIDNYKDMIEYEGVLPVEEKEELDEDGEKLYITGFKFDAHYERGMGATKVLIVGELVPENEEYFSNRNAVEFFGGMDFEYSLNRTHSRYFEEFMDSVKIKDNSLLDYKYTIWARFDAVATSEYFIYVGDYNNVRPHLRNVKIIYYD